MISTVLFLRKGVCAAELKQDVDTIRDEDITESSGDDLIDMVIAPNTNASSSTNNNNTNDNGIEVEEEVEGMDSEDNDEGDGLDFLAEEYDYDPAKDPYVTNLGESALDIDDNIIRQDDYILLSGVAEQDDVSHLDLCLFEKDEDNIYTHHDYLLPAFPLALAWLDFPVGSPDQERLNMVAVATFEPYIEIWDLDKSNTFPAAILGGPEDKREISNGRGYKLMEGSHQDSVLGLSWNKNQRNILASVSADHTCKLWDLTTGVCARTFNYHTNKVQSVEWNPVEAPILVTGGFDKQIVVTDVRLENHVVTVNTQAEIEALHWMPAPLHNLLLVSFEDGSVHCYDVLQNLKLLWQLGAHTKPVHALAVCHAFPGLFATGAPEAESPLKIWDISAQGTPSCIYSKTSNIGPIFALDFSPDSPQILACGVQATLPKIVDLSQFSSVANRYASVPNFAPTNFDFSSINYAPSVGIASKPANNTNSPSPNRSLKKKGKKKGKSKK